MADLAVYHPDVERGGGAEAVCLHIVDALASEHDVTLLTGRNPNLKTLDRRFGTDTAGTDIALLGPLGRHMIDGTRLYTLRHAVCANDVRRRTDAYDGIISAYNELTAPDGALQYIHHPLYRCPSFPEQSTGLLARTSDTFARALARFDPTRGRMVTNSAWSASVLESCRDVRPRVIYPPVDTSRFSDEPWNDRENGFVAVGRITPDKRTELILDIIENIRQRDHNVSLHIVGQSGDSQYATTVRQRAERLEFVTFHGNVTREELTTLLSSNRYGIHAKPHEHFGMAVAEMVAAGMLPFVPDTGGQVEIVGGTDELLYSTVEEAINTIDRVVSSREQQIRLRESLPNPEQRFGCDRFAAEIVAETEAWLEEE